MVIAKTRLMTHINAVMMDRGEQLIEKINREMSRSKVREKLMGPIFM